MVMKFVWNSKCVLVILVTVIATSASINNTQQVVDSLPREKRTITVIARGLANIFGLDVENGQSSTNPTSATPLVLTYPPTQRATTQPYQPLTYPAIRTTTPDPAPITYHPITRAPSPSPPAPAPAPKPRPAPPPPLPPAPSPSPSPSTLMTAKPKPLPPKRLINLRPPLSPSRIVTSGPLTVNTYSQTERTETRSGNLEAKKEVVLIGIPVTIHKVGGLNLGLFNGGADAGQLQHFENVYARNKAKDSENVQHTNKVKESSYKDTKDVNGNKDLNNVGLVEDYDDYRQRISNKLRSQGSSDKTKSNKSPPYKYDEFIIPDVQSHEVENHRDNEDYSDNGPVRETWKFYREESKNVRPPVNSHYSQRDPDQREHNENQGKEEDGNENRGQGNDPLEFERYKDLTIMKVKDNNTGPKNSKQQSYHHEEEERNPSYEENSDYEHHSYDDDDGERDNRPQTSSRKQKPSKEKGGKHRDEEEPVYDSYRNRVKDGRDSYRGFHRETMEDNIGKHRHVDDRDADRERIREESEENKGGGEDYRDPEFGSYDNEWEEKEAEDQRDSYQNTKVKSQQQRKPKPSTGSKSENGGRQQQSQGSRNKQKTPKDEKRNESSGKQQDELEGVPEQPPPPPPPHGEPPSFEYGPPPPPPGAPPGNGHPPEGPPGPIPEPPHHDIGWSPDFGGGGHPHQEPGHFDPGPWSFQPHPGHGAPEPPPGPGNHPGPEPEHDHGKPPPPPPPGGQDSFDYDQYTRNHGVHGFQFPGPYDSSHSHPHGNFWGPPGPAPGPTHSNYVHHGSARPQPYSYETPGYFGPSQHTGYHGHSFGPHQPPSPSGPGAPTGPTGSEQRRGPQNRKSEAKLQNRKTEVEELASDSLSSHLPVRSSRPKKSGAPKGDSRPGQQVRSESKRSGGGRSFPPGSSHYKPGVKSQVHAAPSRPRPVIQAIQQIEGNRPPQLLPPPFDAAFDSSRQVSVSTATKSQVSKQRLKQPFSQVQLKTSLQNTNRKGGPGKFDPFKAKSNEKVELKFGWPTSLLNKDVAQKASHGQNVRRPFTQRTRRHLMKSL